MTAEADEIDRKRREVAELDKRVAIMESHTSLDVARPKAGAIASTVVVIAEETDEEEEFDWGLVTA